MGGGGGGAGAGGRGMARKIGFRAGLALLVGLLAVLCLTGHAFADACAGVKKRKCRLDVNCIFEGSCRSAGPTGPERCAAVQKVRKNKNMRVRCETQAAPLGKCVCSERNPKKPKKCGVCKFEANRTPVIPTPSPTPGPSPFVPINPTPIDGDAANDGD